MIKLDCDYCRDCEDCPFDNNPEKCNAKIHEDTLDFFELVDTADWMQLLKYSAFTQSEPLDSAVLQFEDESNCEEYIFDWENIDEENHKLIDSELKLCKSNEEYIGTLKKWFEKLNVKTQYKIYFFSLEEE